MTSDQIKLVAHAYALRHDEDEVDHWFAPADHLFADAVRLWERGYLDRRRHGEDFVFRLTDEAMVAQEMQQLMTPGSLN